MRNRMSMRSYKKKCEFLLRARGYRSVEASRLSVSAELHMFSPGMGSDHFAFVVYAEILQDRKNLQSICTY